MELLVRPGPIRSLAPSQDHARATYARKIIKETVSDLTDEATVIDRKVRPSSPGLRLHLPAGKRLIIYGRPVSGPPRTSGRRGARGGKEG
jgi:hypothetical protein